MALFSNLSLPHWHNVTFLLNVSRDVPDTLGVILFGYVLPVLLVLTVATNLLIVVVLSQPHMRTPTNLVLLAMAIADLLTLLLPAPWYIYLYSMGNYQQILYPPLKCYIFHFMYEVLPALFHTYSIWLTLLLAGQRYVYVCHFSKARAWCTVPRVIRAILAILVVAVLHQSTRFADRVFLPIEFWWRGSVVRGCQYFTAKWVDNYLGEDNYYICYYGFRILFVHIGPCVSLVVLNVLLFRALHRTQITRQRLFDYSRTSLNASNSFASQPQPQASNPRGTSSVSANNDPYRRSTLPSECSESYPPPAEITENLLYADPLVAALTHQGSGAVSRRDSNSTTIMLIVIVSVFLLLEIPITFTTILHLIQNTLLVTLLDYNILNTIILVTNFFIILSYPINFAIYCGMSRQFRQTFSQLFIHRLGQRGPSLPSAQCGAPHAPSKRRPGGRRKPAVNECVKYCSLCVGEGRGQGEECEVTNDITNASSTTFGLTNAPLTDPADLTPVGNVSALPGPPEEGFERGILLLETRL